MFYLFIFLYYSFINLSLLLLFIHYCPLFVMQNVSERTFKKGWVHLMLHACAGSSNKSNSSAINISIWTCIFKHFITNFCENKNIKPLHAKVHSLRNRPTFRKCQNFTCLQRELQCGPLAQCPLHSGTLVRKFPGYI